MKLEQQVTSSELSKRLKELGVKQESYFSWRFMDVFSTSELSKNELNSPTTYAAFTVAELGESLSVEVASYKTHNEGLNVACIKYVVCEHSKYTNIEWAAAEADARAQMLIYLLENKLITFGWQCRSQQQEWRR